MEGVCAILREVINLVMKFGSFNTQISETQVVQSGLTEGTPLMSPLFTDLVNNQTRNPLSTQQFPV